MAQFGGISETLGKDNVTFGGSSHDNATTRKDWEDEYIKKTPLFQINQNMLSGAAYRT